MLGVQEFVQESKQVINGQVKVRNENCRLQIQKKCLFLLNAVSVRIKTPTLGEKSCKVKKKKKCATPVWQHRAVTHSKLICFKRTTRQDFELQRG